MRDRARWGVPSLGGDARVVVIGGGAAGLAAAHALVQTGYRRVTVLERSARVGGKCCTVPIEGRGYELGAAVLTTAYHHVRELLAEAGMKAVPKVSGLCLDVDTGATSYRVPALHGAAFRGLRDSARMILELVRRGVRAPGFRNLPEELALPFGTWAEGHGRG